MSLKISFPLINDGIYEGVHEDIKYKNKCLYDVITFVMKFIKFYS